MRGSFPAKPVLPRPACPSCGSFDKVVRMPDSLTPFARPDSVDDLGGKFFCQVCSIEFAPEPEGTEL